MMKLRILKSFQIFKTEIKKSKTCSGCCPFLCLSNGSTLMKIQSGQAMPLKGSLTRDFRLQVFFMNQCPPGPQVFHWGRFEFFRKFAEIFANESLTPAINCSAVSTTPAKNLSPESQTDGRREQ
jgi:hypothetical protein